MKSQKQIRRRKGGFTLVELMLASTISVIVLAGTIGIYMEIFRTWRTIDQRMQADSDLNIALSRMVYGMGDRRGIRAAKGVTYTSTDDGWTLAYGTGVSTVQSNRITYSASAQTLVFNPGELILGRDISSAEVDVQARSIQVMLQADRCAGSTQVQREIATEIFWRN